MTMKYGDKIIYMEGVIVEIHDGCVGIDLKGRLGYLKRSSWILEDSDENADYGLSISGRTGSWMEYEFC